MAPLTEAELERSRRRSAETRRAAKSLHARTRATRARTRGILVATDELRGRLVLHSPWSDLPWRLPPRDVGQVLVSVRGGQEAPDGP